MGKKSKRKSQNKDDEIILDFSWLKNIFSVKKKSPQLKMKILL